MLSPAGLMTVRSVVGQALGGDVEEFQGAGLELPVDRLHLGRPDARVEAGGGDAAGLQGIDLILHQGDERRDDQGQSVEEEGRQLVAEALAAAGGEDRQGRAPGEQGVDDPLLPGTKGGKAEVLLQAGMDRCLAGHGNLLEFARGIKVMVSQKP